MVNELTLNPKLDGEDFAIPDKIKEAFFARKRTIEDTPLALNNSPAQELAPGVVMIPGLWNVEEIRQSEGVVILEGPISNGYSKQVIEDAAKRFPGLPIKAVITTSDSWPHIGGLREYAARGIPIYALDLNKPILDRLLSSQHRLSPDALAASPNLSKVVYVSRRTKLGDKTNNIEIIPLRTLTGERQLAVYLPASKILYSSDLFQRDQSGDFFLPQTLSEAAAVVQREHLEVKVDIGMHLAATPWTDIASAIARTPELPKSSATREASP